MRNYLTKNTFFDSAFDSLFDQVYKVNKVSMRTDIIEKEKEFELKVDLAGYKKEDIALNYENGTLTISAKMQESECEGKYLCRERSSSVSRSYYVGDIDKSKVKANYADGVLSVIIPKDKEEKSTAINIE